MNVEQLLEYSRPSNMEVAQRLSKIFFNSCYDKIATSSNFELYEVENKEYPGTDST